MTILLTAVALAIAGMLWFPICFEIYYDYKNRKK